MAPALTSRDGVFVLDLGADENRFTPEWIAAVDAHLDTAEKGAPAALVTTGGGRFYSNGLDLERLGAHLEEYDSYLGRVEGLVARLLTFPMPTVAALPGHAFGFGALLALAHDFRIMREDRGYFCLPEVDLGLPFRPGMVALLRAELPPQTVVEATTTGRRYGGAEALDARIVQATGGLEALTGTAVAHAAGLLGKDGPTVGGIKRELFRDAVALLGGGAR
ncbi:enoyl-CoA hydratase-related protein [Nocardiopsis composta]|uniref:Enoyl-CoA hydratase/carnithine racemase n=1 Tax=Nocardiopsis composta TaxID=157465 RepID=A0A7W8QV03_9ACTN|nr:enoyl-CoA hydratase-related protein [Nocardiopsis composta]MBB5436176.1 enoyl-CoA hydratase/carnithine racemase [Nocardiopsis composta]